MYVYFTYGMHWCANTVCGDEGEGWGVLLRALEPLTGIDRMRVSRPRAKRDTDLCSGPARLAQALSITGANDGADLVLGDQGFRVLADDSVATDAVVAGPRIGISRATEQPWRWYLAGNPHVSRK
jgi:DNA-3-methyladenine glycosylase